MSKAVSIAREQVSTAVRSALEKAVAAGTLVQAEIPAFSVELSLIHISEPTRPY